MTRHAASPPPPSASTPLLDRPRVAQGIVALLVALGAVLRAPGFTAHNLWFDDAWAALPSKEPLRTALKMVATTPLYSLGLRGFIALHPNASWWAQLPAFVLGLAGIIVVAGSLAYLGYGRRTQLLGAALIACSPVTITYATRVKEYSCDVLLTCLLVVLAEWWRRAPSTRRALIVGVASALAMATSSSTVVIAGALATAAVLWAVLVPPVRVQVASFLAVTGIGGLLTYALFLDHLSPTLDVGWTTRGNLFSTASPHEMVFTLQQMFAGLPHFMLGIGDPVPSVGQPIVSRALVLAATSALVLVVLVGNVVLGVAKQRQATAAAPLIAAVGVCAAVGFAMAGISPFGGGRTDAYLYPLLVVLAAELYRALGRWRPAGSRIDLACTAAVGASLVGIGLLNPAAYPTQSLSSVTTPLHRLAPHAQLVVDPWLTYTWGLSGPTPTSVSFAKVYFPWSPGFHVVSTTPRVTISTNYFFPSSAYATLSRHTHLLWYLAATAGAINTGAPNPSSVVVTRNLQTLLALGWRPTGRRLVGLHVVAIEERFEGR